LRVAQAIAALVPESVTLGTPVATTSGTSIDFTGIPSGTKRIVVNFVGVSVSGTSPITVQLGDSGGVENTGYSGRVAADGGASAAMSEGFKLTNAGIATYAYHGVMAIELENSSTNTWSESHVVSYPSASVYFGGGSKSLSAEVDRVRITTVGGSDTFDAGEVNISYES